MSNICLLIGNGFSIDFANHFGLNPSIPFSHFGQKQISYDALLKDLPSIRELFSLAKQDKDEYVAIEKFMESSEYNEQKDCALRRFLSLSYARFQLEVDKYDIQNWKWTRWFKNNKSEMRFAISFNYDLILEKAFKEATIPFYRTGTNEKRNGIPILKPHGSIDFDIDLHSVTSTTKEIQLKETTYLNDVGYVLSIPREKWLTPRYEADIIPPHEENYQRHLRWVKNGIRQFLQRANNIDSLIIVGLSYSDADKKEINQYLERLKKGTTVYVIDPHPNEALIHKINSLGLSLKRGNKNGLPW
ncbi:SIR2 family protein [Evansella cellulosilytica]|uniref:Uncharacterized protein n=1 Tax=Evansella cellulosilytica (strain ATCC 21833 / DSM 2522 / FERM P-1141 / JCM 9156 / N-4) TaxID=649639 RepID=E6TSD2_EVAC2|nr:SIR2 family protein [Evansella cellulosilytica]ADU31901.1 hypothetical protein Bcell_3660 [Evansella cellulosilytica DSM 2522]